MQDAYICDAIRTPFGRYGGALSSIRTDDLAALPMRQMISRNPQVDWAAVDEVVLRCANQAGEDNRNVARMATLLSGMPFTVPASTINRLCASGMDTVGTAARAVKSGEAQLMVVGGVESVSRSLYVVGKAGRGFSRLQLMFDTTLGWRFVNPLMQRGFGVHSMPETAENVADRFHISRHDQDSLALRSQQRAAKAIKNAFFRDETMNVEVTENKGARFVVEEDEHPRQTDAARLAQLKPIVRQHGTIIAGNSRGVNDGACVLLIASGKSANEHALKPRARRWHDCRRRGATYHGICPCTCGSQAFSINRNADQWNGCNRA